MAWSCFLSGPGYVIHTHSFINSRNVPIGSQANVRPNLNIHLLIHASDQTGDSSMNQMVDDSSTRYLSNGFFSIIQWPSLHGLDIPARVLPFRPLGEENPCVNACVACRYFTSWDETVEHLRRIRWVYWNLVHCSASGKRLFHVIPVRCTDTDSVHFRASDLSIQISKFEVIELAGS